MEINLYDEMNQNIVPLLRLGEEPYEMYAAALIEHLQADNARLRAELERVERERDAAVKDIYVSANEPFHCGICKKQNTKCEARPDGSCAFEYRATEVHP